MRHATMVLKQGEIFVVSDERGEIGRNVPGAGIYFRDTRYLSDYHLALNGETPELLDSSAEHNAIAIVQMGNPCLAASDSHEILPNTIGVRRYREVGHHVTEQIEVHNYNDFAVTLELSLTFSADFRDIFDIRGFRRMKRGRVLLPRRHGQDLILGYRAPDGAVSETVIHFDRPPDEATIEAGAGYTTELEELRTMLPGNDRIVRSRPMDRPPRASLLFRLSLGAQERTRLQMRMTPRALLQEHEGFVTPNFDVLAQAHGPEERFTAVFTNHEGFNRVLDRSLRDLRTLVTPFPGGRLVAAGIPWYVAPFGRDAAITALQMLMYSPDIALETLRFLARHQGKKVDTWTEEEPGKILHELRFGEMARLGEVPHTPYYGTVDATPLFIILFCRVMRWLGTRELLDEFQPAVELALRWIDEYGDSDGDGFVDYGRRSRRGLENQNWKDSDNSLQFPDRSQVLAPIAPVEVQGYVYQAKREYADLLALYGADARAAELRRQAEDLRERFEAAFWSAPDEFYGQAIDGSGRLVPAISSNPGHCLFSGILGSERAEPVIRRLRAPDMYSGWGIRTLSSEMPHYNPMSYH
ncbi:MAG: amylo-alpha-1,6-glucosidase, partial [Thermomicrobiaceae bacterium]|nr:amylo-alpha-1,6-glucosidase [Thermomicrobiaceae bacterium]